MLDYHIYRHLLSVLRELLSNIIRHADASQLDVRLQVNGMMLDVELVSNGKCFDGNANSGGHGLANLHRRIDLMGARLQFLPQVQGTQIILAIPLTEARSEEHTAELQSLMRISYAVSCLK